MKSIEKWADRVYAENDFGRSVAISVSGLIGLVVYLPTRDWVIRIFHNNFIPDYPLGLNGSK